MIARRLPPASRSDGVRTVKLYLQAGLQDEDRVIVPAQKSSVVGAAAWAMVALLWVAYFLNYTDRQIVFSVYPALRKELHFTNAQLGLIGSLFLWVYAMGMGISGRIAD